MVVDDDNVINFMIEASESLEGVRKEKFFGWYHTHPFDYDPNSSTGHCFMSATDVTTQLQWQRGEDPHGNPWLAIVIDPLRSIAKGRPELMAFRAYPPEYEAPAGEAPDGKTVTDAVGQKLWGPCWRRYYRLETSYFMSSLAQQTFRILKNNMSFSESLCSMPSRNSDRLKAEVDSITDITSRINSASGAVKTSGDSSSNAADESNLQTADRIGSKLATGRCECCSTTIVKYQLFMAARRSEHVSEPGYDDIDGAS